MAQEVLVLGVKRYGFVNEQTGERVEGTKVEFLEGFDYPFEESNMKGVFPLNVTAPYNFFEKFDQLPAYYQIEFRQRPDKNGKPVSVPVGVKYSRPLELKTQNLKAV